MTATVLVVDAESAFRKLAEEALSSEGFAVRTAASLRQARRELEAAAPDVMLLDRRLPDGDGICFLKALRKEDQVPAPTLVVTVHDDVRNAVEALQAGACDYLTRPVQHTDLVVRLRKALETRGLRERLALAHQGAAGHPTVELRSAVMRAVRERLASISQSGQTPVLIQGPSGVGKRRAAEMLHAMTSAPGDSDAPFVELGCAAFADNLVESELFGHEKGAFRDARNSRRGLIEIAAGGTLFLDEVVALPQRSQASLVQFLDRGRFRRLGGPREIAVDLRIVAATKQDIDAAVADGRLRADLYHRLTVFMIRIPPLSSRPQDVLELARSFVAFFAVRVKKRPLELSDRALDVLLAYDYPGNVRELRNIVERAVILAPGPQVTERDIVLPEPAGPRETTAFFSVNSSAERSPPPLEEVERTYVARVLEHFGGRRMTAAQALGISYPTFLKRIRHGGK